MDYLFDAHSEGTPCDININVIDIPVKNTFNELSSLTIRVFILLAVLTTTDI